MRVRNEIMYAMMACKNGHTNNPYSATSWHSSELCQVTKVCAISCVLTRHSRTS
jgi:hypothetical protein